MSEASADNWTVLELDGEIDLNRSPEISSKLKEMIEGGSRKVAIDLHEVRYIDSSGLAVFIDAMQRVQAVGGEFKLQRIPSEIRGIFAVSRLDQVFKIEA